MVELVDTRDLKSRDPCDRASSILALGTRNIKGSQFLDCGPFFFVNSGSVQLLYYF